MGGGKGDTFLSHLGPSPLCVHVRPRRPPETSGEKNFDPLAEEGRNCRRYLFIRVARCTAQGYIAARV